jgi:addiction module HigA family antidote
LKSSKPTANGKGNKVPLLRPAQGWNYQYGPTSPGEMLAEDFLKPLGLSQHQLAMNIRVPSTWIGEIVRGKRAITPDTALRLARFFNNSPEFWLNLQQMHDLTKAKLALSKTIETEVRVSWVEVHRPAIAKPE